LDANASREKESMATLVYDEIVKKICDEKQIQATEVHGRVKEKLQQLSDLISKEGAAHIVANELGVKVYEIPKNLGRRITVSELNPAFKGVEMLVKVLKVNEVRTFKTAAREGKVLNLLVGDESGTCRLVLWDEKNIKEVEEGFVKEGMTLKIMNCYVKDNSFGGKEVHMGSQATWTLNPLGEQLGTVATAPNTPSFAPAQKKAIKDLQENDVATVVGTIVQVFEPRFYDGCPTCSKKVEFNGDGFKCSNHGAVMSVPQAILNIVFDDGTDNIRVVSFRDNVKQILEMDDVSVLKDNADAFRDVQRKVAGKQLRIQGRVQKNTFFNRLEMTSNSVLAADPKELAMELN